MLKFQARPGISERKAHATSHDGVKATRPLIALHPPDVRGHERAAEAGVDVGRAIVGRRLYWCWRSRLPTGCDTGLS
jgi:hypothetical protein